MGVGGGGGGWWWGLEGLRGRYGGAGCPFTLRGSLFFTLHGNAYGVHAATYLAIVTRDLAGVHLH